MCGGEQEDGGGTVVCVGEDWGPGYGLVADVGEHARAVVDAGGAAAVGALGEVEKLRGGGEGGVGDAVGEGCDGGDSVGC